MHIRRQVVLKRWAHPNPDSLRGEEVGVRRQADGDRNFRGDDTGVLTARGMGGGHPGSAPNAPPARRRRLRLTDHHLRQLTAPSEEMEVREAGGPRLSILILADATGLDLLPNI